MFYTGSFKGTNTSLGDLGVQGLGLKGLRRLGVWVCRVEGL